MYKLVLLDLDGTLLNSDKKITEYTCRVLKKLKENTKIVLASARGFWRIKSYIEEIGTLNSDNYTIAFNGSLILKNNEEPIIDNKIEKKNLLELSKFIKNTKKGQWQLYSYEKNTNTKDIDNLEMFFEENDIYKVVYVSIEEEIENIKQNVIDKFSSNFQISSSEPTRIEFVKKGMTKLEAIKFLLEHLNIKPEEIIAIGDGENDMDMITFAGIGVAMENAPQEVKDKANKITASNDNDGVGKVLNDIFALGIE